jgi:hypothetical protein
MLPEHPGLRNRGKHPEAIAKFGKLDIITRIVKYLIVTPDGTYDGSRKIQSEALLHPAPVLRDLVVSTGHCSGSPASPSRASGNEP